MSCGAWCVYFTSRGVSSACAGCSFYEVTNKPSLFIDEIDPFKMAIMLKIKKAMKEEMERRSKIPQLSNCPQCLKHSLFYNNIADQFECLNLQCKIIISQSSLDYKRIIVIIFNTTNKENNESN